MKTIATLLTALALAGCAHSAPSNVASSKESLQWIEDDYPAALARAKAEGKPLFLDVWATWCHSCLSMKRYVFTDAGMLAAKDAAIYASVDQERPQNRDVVKKFPVEGLPTFLLIDPKDESVMGRWLGSGTVTDLRAFVLDGAAQLGGGQPGSALALARQGDEAQMKNDWPTAAQRYEEAVAKADAQARVRPQLLVKLASALGHVGTPEAQARCAQLGEQELDNTGNTSLAGDFTQGAIGCAGKAASPALRQRAEQKLQTLASDPGAPLAVDDRSDMLGALTGWLEDDGKHDAAVAAAQQRKQVLLAGQAAAPEPELQSTFDAHLAETYLFLGEAPRAEAMLAAREKQMPDDYNPPARLARVLFEEKRLPEAEQAIDRALKLSPDGPRKVGFLALKARILAAAGKEQADALREELTLLRSLPRRNPEVEKRVEKQLQEAPRAAQ